MRLSSLAGRLADVLQDGGWHSKARPEQLPPPGDWNGWLLMAGRGFGKTRTRPRALRHGEETEGRKSRAFGCVVRDVL